MPNLIDKSITTIIITDDNPVNVKIIKTMLDKEGYRTATATDGAKCIDETKKLKPNLILLDINMPGMNGLEVCKVIKQDQQARNTPVIFVTANTDDETLKEAFESGGTDYIRKPVNRMELLARIKAALAQKELMERIMKEEKLKGVLEMAGSICHEMNQPMMSISGYFFRKFLFKFYPETSIRLGTVFLAPGNPCIPDKTIPIIVIKNDECYRFVNFRPEALCLNLSAGLPFNEIK